MAERTDYGCARNDILAALEEALPTPQEPLAYIRLANALMEAVDRRIFEAIDERLALVPLECRVEEAERLAAALQEVRTGLETVIQKERAAAPKVAPSGTSGHSRPRSAISRRVPSGHPRLHGSQRRDQARCDGRQLQHQRDDPEEAT